MALPEPSDTRGDWKIYVNPNIPISEIMKAVGPAPTPDAEVGIHSETIAGQWVREQIGLRVLQIFTERSPRPDCASMLRTWFPGVPWYYYNRKTWIQGKRVIKYPSEILPTAYGL